MLFSATVFASSASIISESQIITQKKGQPLTGALKPLNLSAYQKRIINNSSLNKVTKHTKRFKFIFEKSAEKKLLRGLVVRSRDTKIYKVVAAQNTHELRLQSVTSIPIKKLDVSKYFKVANNKSSKPIKRAVKKRAVKKPATKKKSTTKTSNPSSVSSLKSINQLSSIAFYLTKNARASDELSQLDNHLLSKKQEQAILSLKQIKNRSDNCWIILYFNETSQSKKLQAIALEYGTYHQYFWVDNRQKIKALSSFNSPQRSKMLSLFKDSDTKYLKKRQIALESNKNTSSDPIVLTTQAKQNTPPKNTPPKIKLATVDRSEKKKTYRIINSLNDNSISSNRSLKEKKPNKKKKTEKQNKRPKKNQPTTKRINYSVYQKTMGGQTKIMRIRQKRGESLNTSLKRANLSKLQINLINRVPANKRAISNRYIFLLFKNKLLKAIYFVRGKASIGYALINHNGVLSWVNQKGEISTEKKSFNRYPLSNPKISSHYNPRRKHPITGRVRPHKGTDFRAAHGTPIFAPYDGVVSFAGRQSGFGITLEINHQNGYKTLYAHLSKIQKVARRKGNRIKKGDLIARVGNTGVSTGAHLHYEIKLNGRHRNPMKVKLPKAPAKKVTSVSKRAIRTYLTPLEKQAKSWK